ncbi:hypothetical protein BDQ17DRAFT_1432433 [Cyathus striatus]|nr:hypothetical protein BDQ17DRAFT_1432433 [Cyathus striatus]
MVILTIQNQRLPTATSPGYRLGEVISSLAPLRSFVNKTADRGVIVKKLDFHRACPKKWKIDALGGSLLCAVHSLGPQAHRKSSWGLLLDDNRYALLLLLLTGASSQLPPLPKHNRLSTLSPAPYELCYCMKDLYRPRVVDSDMLSYGMISTCPWMTSDIPETVGRPVGFSHPLLGATELLMGNGAPFLSESLVPSRRIDEMDAVSNSVLRYQSCGFLAPSSWTTKDLVRERMAMVDTTLDMTW